LAPAIPASVTALASAWLGLAAAWIHGLLRAARPAEPRPGEHPDSLLVLAALLIVGGWRLLRHGGAAAGPADFAGVGVLATLLVVDAALARAGAIRGAGALLALAVLTAAASFGPLPTPLWFVFIAIALSPLARRPFRHLTPFAIGTSGMSALFLGGSVWHGWYLAPDIDLYAPAINSHSDPLFHLAIAHISQTWETASIGVHGLVPIAYHTGSHTLMARLASLTGLTVPTAYPLLMGTLFAPLLVWAAMTAARAMRERLRPGTAGPGTAALAFLTMALALPWPHLFADTPGRPDTLFTSESFQISLTLAMLGAAVLIGAGMPRRGAGIGRTLLWLLLFPLGLWLVGRIKISTAMLAGVAYAASFFALGAWRRKTAWLAGALGAIAVLATWGSYGATPLEFGPLHFFSSCPPGTSPRWGLLATGLWPFVLLVWPMRTQTEAQATGQAGLRAALAAIWAAGLLVAALLKTPACDAIYFLEPARLLALIGLLALMPRLPRPAGPGRRLLITLVLVLPLLISVAERVVARGHEVFVRHAARERHLGGARIPTLDASTLAALSLLPVADSALQLAHDVHARRVGPTATTPSNLGAVLRDVAARPVADKQRTLWWMPAAAWPTWNKLDCMRTALLLPALSGVPAIGGLPDPASCAVAGLQNGHYGFGDYQPTPWAQAWRPDLGPAAAGITGSVELAALTAPGFPDLADIRTWLIALPAGSSTIEALPAGAASLRLLGPAAATVTAAAGGAWRVDASAPTLAELVMADKRRLLSLGVRPTAAAN
jgi:hypothetical protein